MKKYQEVSPKRLEEYNSIVDEVDKRAKALMSEEMGMPEDCCVMGGCHVFWKHKKRILRRRIPYGLAQPSGSQSYCAF